jgi:hypothetical protein
LSDADVLVVQVIPSGEVITLFPVPRLDTAANNPNSADQQTDLHSFVVTDAVLVVQVIPSGEVITLFAPTAEETATNKRLSGDQQMARQEFASGAASPTQLDVPVT